MPRYFFQITEGELLPDLDGVELADLAAARRVAVDIAAERLRGNGEEFWNAGHWRVEINDENGIVLDALSVTTASATATQPIPNGASRPAAR